MFSIGFGQTFTTNETPVGMEHNVLFDAENRYTVTQTGPALNLNMLFDGVFSPSYSTTGPSITNPTIIEIAGLSNTHTQLGAWVGWSTRYRESNRFKIEGYDTYQGINTWRIIADYSAIDYTGGKNFSKKIPLGGIYTKLRFTFYSSVAQDNRFGISELFFINPEATTPYQGLLSLASSSHWNLIGNNINYTNGNVGIGITTPTAGLHVKHDDGIKIGESASNYTGTIKMADGFTNTTTKDDLLFSTAGGFMFKMDDDGNGISNVQGFNVYNKNESVFTIKELNGNVGIGTARPLAKLDILKNTDLSNFNTMRTSGSGLIIKTRNIGRYASLKFGVDNTNLKAVIQTVQTRTLVKFDLLINPFGGNVGIGTNAPDEKLTVKGKIHTQEVRVDLLGPLAGPDYVFEKYFNGVSKLKPDYKMPTLKEVEAFTRANNHLPEIPSAQEMQENGIQLKAMNLKLLQKIEELTLYTIEQQKEIEQQQAQLKSQQKENILLNNRLKNIEAIISKLEK